ncbi:MAG: hypothetical protein QM627_11160 [Luteolibacter sp.]
MQPLLRKPLVLATAFAFTVLSSGLSFGQAARATVEKPKFDTLPSPEFSGGGKQKDFKPKDWLEVEAKVRLEMQPTPKTNTCDKVEVIWYVAAPNPDKAASFYKIKRTVTYMNVPVGEDVYVSAYLSPASMKRLTGNDGAGKRALRYVAVEVRVNGQVVGSASDGPQNWWNQASDKVSETSVVKLMDKSETPFNAMWWDRYPEIDPTAPKTQ